MKLVRVQDIIGTDPDVNGPGWTITISTDWGRNQRHAADLYVHPSGYRQEVHDEVGADLPDNGEVQAE